MLNVLYMLDVMQRCVRYMEDDGYTDEQIDKFMGFPVDVNPSDYITEKWWKAYNLKFKINPETGKNYTSLEIAKKIYLIGDRDVLF